MVYIIATPAGSVSGGPELTHQLCHTLRAYGQKAYLYYYDDFGAIIDTPAPDVYAKYDSSHITDDTLLHSDSTVFIVPEVAIPLLDKYPDCRRYLWWLSVDNYLHTVELTVQADHPDVYHLADKPDIFHLVQSAYAKDFLLHKIGVPCEHISVLSDYLNEEFFRVQISDRFKQNFIAYNPKKGYKILKPIIDASPQFQWFPIINMTPSDVGNLLRLAKVYIDFGNHPGKDRIPREAAISGCCVITNKKGSAAYHEDIPIPDDYKFDDPLAQQAEIIELIQDIFENYSSHRPNYDEYLSMIRGEASKFTADVKAVLIDSFSK